MFNKIIENVKNNTPLVHCITNYVTVNDCANVLLASGASPIMADDIREVEEMVTISGGLYINIGTLNERTIKSMLLAGEKANSLNKIVVLDPVGAGATKLRTEVSYKLLEKVEFSVIRGNISEIKTLALGQGNTKGVDADVSDIVTEENIDSVVDFAKKFAKKTNSIIAITGAIDIVADEKTAYIIKNGDSMMSKVTGTGCMLTAIVTAFATANKENVLKATAIAVTIMGLSGELAKKRLKENEGNATYRNYIIDEICNMTAEKLEKGAKYAIK